MRWTLAFALALVGHAGFLATPGRAQQAAARAPARLSPGLELLRPYGSSLARPSPRDPKAVYKSPPSKRPIVPPIQERTARAAVFQGVGNYYPAMRPGQGPNFNALDPGTKTLSPARRPPINPAR
jgi:hypothetical protein